MAAALTQPARKGKGKVTTRAKAAATTTTATEPKRSAAKAIANRLAPATPAGFGALVETIRHADHALTAQAVKAVNISLTLRNWFIGCYIAEFEYRGADRARYGDRLLPELAKALGKRKVSNSGMRQLYSYLSFYRAYPNILRTASAKSLSRAAGLILPSMPTKKATSSCWSNKPNLSSAASMKFRHCAPTGRCANSSDRSRPSVLNARVFLIERRSPQPNSWQQRMDHPMTSRI
jgi:hypothetical protein